MIIVKFIGGLGNQMFQYAFYRFIKEKYGHLWGKEDSYLYSKNEILSEIKDFVENYYGFSK